MITERKNKWEYSMAFSTLASREMIIKSTGFLILIHLIAIRGKKKLFIFIILYFLIFFFSCTWILRMCWRIGTLFKSNTLYKTWGNLYRLSWLCWSRWRENLFVLLFYTNIFWLFEHFPPGNHCQKGTTDTIACVTHIESPLTFECLSPNQICNGEKTCINNEDEDQCGSWNRFI